MKGSEEHIDKLIERYVLEKMSPEERNEFEKEIQADPLLQALVSEDHYLKQVIQSEAKVNKFQTTLAQVIEEKKQPSHSYSFWWKVAAVFVLVMSGVILLFQINTTTSSPELASSYFEPFPDLITSRDETDSLVALAMTAYNAQAYAQAIPTLKNLVSDEAPLFEFYLGVSYQASERYEKALDLWSRLEVDNESALIYSVKWYKALTLLSLNQSEKAKQILQELAAGQSSVQERAKNLLTELK